MTWCDENNMSLNAEKTKEINMDFRKQSSPHCPVNIDEEEVDVVSLFCCLGCVISLQI